MINTDAIQEVNIQTADFSSELGRGEAAVFNQIIKLRTNELHGTATYVYDGSSFAALTHLQEISGKKSPPRQVENIPDFAIGGPVVFPHLYHGHSKTFFRRRAVGPFVRECHLVNSFDAAHCRWRGHTAITGRAMS